MDEQQGLVSFSASMNDEYPPDFYIMAKKKKEKDSDADEVVITNNGTIQAMYENANLRAIFKCTMFCTP